MQRAIDSFLLEVFSNSRFPPTKSFSPFAISYSPPTNFCPSLFSINVKVPPICAFRLIQSCLFEANPLLFSPCPPKFESKFPLLSALLALKDSFIWKSAPEKLGGRSYAAGSLAPASVPPDSACYLLGDLLRIDICRVVLRSVDVNRFKLNCVSGGRSCRRKHLGTRGLSG